MKLTITSFFLCLAFLAHGQISDTSLVRVEVDSLIKLNKSLINHGEIDSALLIILQAEKLCLNNFGEETEMYLSIATKIGGAYFHKRDISNAQLFYLKAKNLSEKLLGKEHTVYHGNLVNLGNVNWFLGDYQKSEEYYLQALSLMRNDKNYAEQINYANCVSNLGGLYQILGQYDKALPLMLEGRAIQEKKLNRDHPDFAYGLTKLGHLHYNMGHYEKAEPLYLEAISIFESVEELQNHPNYVNTLIALGVLYSDIGQYEKTEGLYLKAKEIQEKSLGKEHAHYLGSLVNLGTLYSDLDQDDKSEAFYLEAKSIFESKEELLEHPFYFTCINNLGLLYLTMDKYDQAEPILLKAKTIRGKNLGKEHPEYAESLNNIGLMYSEMDQKEKALENYLEAKAIREKVLGKDHVDYALILNNLGALYWDMKEYEKAENLLLKANEIRKRRVLKATRYLSENELQDYTGNFIYFQNQLLSFVGSQKRANGDAYNNSLFYKGFLLNATQQLQGLAITDSVSLKQFLKLKEYNSSLAAAYSSPLASQDSIAIVELENKAISLEKELTRTISGFGEAIQQVNWQEVQAVLQPGDAAIEFIHYGFHNPNPTDSIKYAAILLRPGEVPKVINLFEETSLNDLLADHKDRRSDYVNDLYSMEDRGVEIQDEHKRTLYELIWEPIQENLKGISRIYFSPSGLLHRINLGAIPIDDELCLCDKYDLVQLNSTRQLVISHPIIPRTSDALLMGGIEYDSDSIFINSNDEDLILEELMASRGQFDLKNPESVLRGGSWNYLKYTEKEVTAIDEILSTAGYQSEIKTGYEATEDLFRESGQEDVSPRFIHLATHGFFFPDPGKNKSNSDTEHEEASFKTSDHPMMRSGLILAGGNQTWQGKPMTNGKEDGILTAYEISQMDLSNTELVVLSACETGLGDIEGNEGVYGLQRAFKIAGVKYLIMSLWQVPDRETKDFMVTFYEHLLNDKMTIPEAFHTTQKEMKERFYNPYQWAGFVLVE